jgi:hypothetical protein
MEVIGIITESLSPLIYMSFGSLLRYNRSDSLKSLYMTLQLIEDDLSTAQVFVIGHE